MTNLIPENQSHIDHLIVTGVYSSPDQALDEAVQLLRDRNAVREQVQAGQAQADRGELIPASAVFERLEARVRDVEQQSQQ